MNIRISAAAAASILLLLTGCIDDTFFGASDLKQVRSFTLQSQVGASTIDNDSLMIRVEVTPDADLSALRPTSFVVSTFATIDPSPELPQDFSRPVTYTVTAENGSKARYTVYAAQQGGEPQLPNSNFDTWYLAAAGYYQPGSGPDNPVWSSANEGVEVLGKANTLPLDLGGGDIAVQLVTRDLGTLAGLSGQRMASATIFTGEFKLNLADPPSSALIGYSFVARPAGFRVRYRYAPGTEYRDGRGNVLSRQDSCDIYVLLEQRDGARIKRIATAWLRSPEPRSGWTTLELPLIYGALDPSTTPYYMLPPRGQSFGSDSDPVTHISVVFASSARGILYEGATGSTLELNDFELTY